MMASGKWRRASKACSPRIRTSLFLLPSPGAGRAMAPRLLTAFGSQRERFASGNEVQSYAGIAPVREASGKQCGIHFRWACPKFVRQSFHEYAALSLQQCAWALEFYDKQRARGKGHQAAVRSLAF